MKNWHILVLFLISFAILAIGALFKLMHWPYASEMLMIGTFGKVLSAILLIIKLVRNKKAIDFLNK